MDEDRLMTVAEVAERLRVDPETVRRMTRLGASLAARASPEFGAQLESLLAERPLAYERPQHGLTALTNRMLAYLDA